jgi:cyanophycinase-like exopeptidase
MRTGGALPGLGWLAETVVDTGFDPEDDSSLRRLMSVPDVRLGLGIPAGTALVVRGDGSTEILGSGSIAVFRKA